MKKISFMFTMLLTVLMCSLVITSCSCDDDEEENKESVQQIFLICPDNNHPHMIDLGLPSGTKWACCNVGASSPEKAGGYYAWGETEEKDFYYESNYRFVKGKDNDGDGQIDEGLEIIDIGDNIAGTPYDVANVQWGIKWQMPTEEQFWELWSRCKKNKIKTNSIDCMEFIGSNGGRIIIPLVGVKSGLEFQNSGIGCYWTSDALRGFNSEIILSAKSVIFSVESLMIMGSGKTSDGLPIRAISN